jgi:SHO1 osmosensor
MSFSSPILTLSKQLAWLIAFIACIISNVQEPQGFPKFPWWAVIYSLFQNIGIFVVVASDSIQTYHVAISSYVSAGLVLASSSVNVVIYSNYGSRQAVAAGFILLAMIDVCCFDSRLPTSAVH